MYSDIPQRLMQIFKEPILNVWTKIDGEWKPLYDYKFSNPVYKSSSSDGVHRDVTFDCHRDDDMMVDCAYCTEHDPDHLYFHRLLSPDEPKSYELYSSPQHQLEDYIHTFTYPYPIESAMITSVQMPETTHVYVNDDLAYVSIIGEYVINRDISAYVHSGVNTIRVHHLNPGMHNGHKVNITITPRLYDIDT